MDGVKWRFALDSRERAIGADNCVWNPEGYALL